MDLFNGNEVYQPGSDLDAYNPYGPSVSYARTYNSAFPQYYQNGAAIPIGWADNYDYVVHDALSYDLNGNRIWGPVDLVYPNGARETLTPVLSAGVPTGAFTTETGVPYVVTGVRSTTVTGEWVSVTVTGADGTKRVFKKVSSLGNLGQDYALVDALPTAGNGLHFARDVTNRLTAVQAYNGASTVNLLTFTYAVVSGISRLTQVTDASGARKVKYGYDPVHFNLTTVSQVLTSGDATNPPPNRWTYGYDSVEGLVTLTTITVPSPTGTGTATSTIAYAPVGFYGVWYKEVQFTDANGNKKVYAYDSGPNYDQTEVSLFAANNPSGTPDRHWFQKFDSDGRNAGTVDADGNETTVEYTDTLNPDKPTGVTDRAGRQTTYTYEIAPNGVSYGRVETVTVPAGTSSGVTLTTTYGYDYSKAGFPLGLVTSVQEGSKPATTFGYNTNGTLASVTAPAPSGSGVTSVTTAYTYTTLGQVATVTAPGNNAAASVTTTLNYTTDGAYTKPGGEAMGQPVRVTVGSSTPSLYTSYRYGALGRVSSAIDAAGNTTDYTYTLSGAPKRVTYPATGQTGSGRGYVENTYQYGTSPNDYGRLLNTKLYTEAGTLFRTTSYTYGKEGERLGVDGAANEPAAYAYAPDYQVASVTDGNGHATKYEYDANGLLTHVRYPLASPTADTGSDIVKVARNADGSPSVVTDGRGGTKTYGYYPSGTLHTVAYSLDSTQNVTYTYDGYNRLTNVSDGTGSRSYGYGNLDEPTSATTTYTGIAAKTLSYAYYPDGSRKTLTSPVSATPFTYSYDAIGRLSSLANPFSETTGWGYKANGWLDHRTDYNSLTATYTYNAMGRLTALTNVQGGDTISTFAGNSSGTGSMGYDAAGNRLSVTVYNPWYSTLTSGTVTNGYDGQDRLTSDVSTFLGARSHAFAYDGAGNPTTFKNVAIPSTSYDADNKRTGTGYGYDGDGNPTTYKTKVLQYDVEDRLKSYGTSTTTTLTMGYRSDGLRAWKQTSGGVRTYFLYDGATLLHEVNSSGTITATDTWGADGLVSRYTSTAPSFYAYTPSGNVADVTGLGSTTPTAQEYDAYGGAVAGGGASPHGYGAQWGYYTDTQTGLVLCTWRYYDPANGRFVTWDPIGQDGGINLYAYTGNNPVNFVDPSGLDAGWAGNPYPNDPYGEGRPGGGPLNHCVILAVINRHHSDPKFMGGDPKQPLTDMDLLEHQELHKDMYCYLEGCTDDAGHNMRPTRSNSGSDIQENFSRKERLNALKDFYDKFKDKYPDASRDFFNQHPDLNTCGSCASEGGVEAGEGIGIGGAYLPEQPEGGGGCFISGTLVSMGNGSFKPIDKIKTGDSVLSWDEVSNQITAKRVKRLLVHRVNEALIMKLSDGETLNTTRVHRFYTIGLGFVEAGKLGKNAELLSLSGSKIHIKRIDVVHEKAHFVYNLEVDDFHTFFVGKDKIVVHNSKADDMPW